MIKARGGSPLSGVRKQSRTISKRRPRRPLYPNQVDEKYYECWNCGFTCKLGREEKGGSNTPSSITYTDEEDYTPTDSFPDYMNYDIDGSYCPLCHSPNWQGEY